MAGIAGILALNACDKEEYTGDNTLPYGGAMAFRVDVPATRALIDKSDNTGGENNLVYMCDPDKGGNKIGLWGNVSYNGTKYSLMTGNELVYNGGWTYGDPIYWIKGGIHGFRAIYPYNLINGAIENNASADGMILNYDIGYQYDIMMSETSVNTSAATFDPADPVKLTFRHLLSAVKFIFRYKEGIYGEDKLVSCYLQNAADNDALPISAQFSFSGSGNGIVPIHTPTDAFYIWETNPQEGDMCKIMRNAESYTAAIAYVNDDSNPSFVHEQSKIYTKNNGYIMVVPGFSLKNTELVFTLESTGTQEYRVTLPSEFIYTDESGIQHTSTVLEAGMRYTVTVNIDNTILTRASDDDISVSVIVE